MSATGAPSSVAVPFCAPAIVTRDPPATADRTAVDWPFELKVAATPPGSWSSCREVAASTIVVTSPEMRSARWPSWSNTICRAATDTVRVDSSFLLEPSNTASEGCVCGCDEVTEAKILPFAWSTWIEVTVPPTANAVEPTTVLVAPSISMSACWLESSSTRIVFAASLRASAVGRPPTTIVAMSAFVSASSAPTVPSFGCAT